MAETAHVQDLIPFYLLGALDEAEVKKVEEHLEHCPTCRALLQEQREGAAVLPFAVTPVKPSPLVKQKLLARVDADVRASRLAPAPPPRHGAPRWNPINFWRAASPALALASMVLLILALAWALVQRAEVEQLRAELNEQRAVLALLTQPGTVTRDFQTTAAQPNARGTLHANFQDTRALVIVSGLKPLPPGRVYEVWLIKDTTPVGVGTFTVDPDGRGQIAISAPEAIGAYQLSALTEEPRGGSPLPTTEPFMSTKF